LLITIVDTKWLTPEEKEYAIWRIADEAAGLEDGEDGQSVWVGAIEALKDPKVYMLILLQFSLLTGMAYVRLRCPYYLFQN
jgi:hypothetical protein